MTNEQGLFTKIKESSLSISLTAALILVASIVVIISSITIQSAYMWLAVGATAVLFLGFCSCTTCEKTSHFHFRRGSIHSDSVSTISDGRDNFYEVRACGAAWACAAGLPNEVGHLQNNTPYWIADLPPSYAVATAASMSPDCQLPPPYSAVAEVHGHIQSYSDINKPQEQNYIGNVQSTSPETAVMIEDTNISESGDSASSPINAPLGNSQVTNNRTVRNGDTVHPSSCRCDSCVLQSTSLC